MQEIIIIVKDVILRDLVFRFFELPRVEKDERAPAM